MVFAFICFNLSILCSLSLLYFDISHIYLFGVGCLCDFVYIEFIRYPGATMEKYNKLREYILFLQSECITIPESIPEIKSQNNIELILQSIPEMNSIGTSQNNIERIKELIVCLNRQSNFEIDINEESYIRYKKRKINYLMFNKNEKENSNKILYTLQETKDKLSHVQQKLKNKEEKCIQLIQNNNNLNEKLKIHYLVSKS